MTQTITVYSKVGCGQCQFTKNYLDKHEVAYTEKNISMNSDWVDEVKALGFQSLPVIIPPDGQAFHGFQPDKLDQLVVHDD